jgi:uncharacterized protein YbaR (Trm112 family)
MHTSEQATQRTDHTMSIEPALLAILACPDDKGPLYHLEAEQLLLNPRLRRAYPIRDGIPVMLIEEADELDEAECDRLMGLVAERGIEPTFAD